VPEIPDEIKRQLAKLSQRLDRRADKCRVLERYYDGSSPLPAAVVRANVTRAYRMLMPVAEAPWGSLVVDSTLDRLEPSGIRSGDKEVDRKAWGVWQDNKMDAESKLAHNAALIDGRANALVWRGDDDAFPTISLDDASTMIVQYHEGSRRNRVAALRRWMDDDQVPSATLYRRDGIFKFRGPKHSSGRAGTQWEPRIGPRDQGEWPLANPFDTVPVVEVAINRRLKPGSFPYARGEYENCTGLIDRINLLTFLGLVVAFYMGFPLRGTVGQKIIRDVLRDDRGEPIIDEATGKPKEEAVAPFDASAAGFFQLENKDAKIVQYEAADRKNLSVLAELDQLSTITKTPRHYFPMEGGMSNLAADAIRASEGSLHAKVTGHKASLGEGWEDVHRLAGRMAKEPYELSPRAELTWKDHESRSLAERADAASKLKDVVPWQVVAEMALNATQEEIARWTAERGADSLTKLVAEAQTPSNGGTTIPVG